MRYAEFLQPGGTIGFIAPSFGCNIEPYYSAFQNAQKKFQDLGYQLCIGPNCYLGEGIGISNTPQKCGEEAVRYLTGQNCDVVISCGGGELMCEILPYVDFQKIREAPPKWYMGFSDNTNMTFLLPTLADTAAVYGPCAPAFGMEPWHPVVQSALDLLCGRSLAVCGYDKWEKESLKTEEHPLEPYNVTEPTLLKSYIGPVACKKEIHISGRLLGGCLDCLSTLTGTRFDRVKEFNQRYGKDGIIWFLEACDLNPMGIRRAVWQMKEAGWFDCTAGFLIGRALCGPEEFLGLDPCHAVLDIVQEYQVPVIMDIDLGHLPPSMPLICGALAEVSVKGNDILVKQDKERRM